MAERPKDTKHETEGRGEDSRVSGSLRAGRATAQPDFVLSETSTGNPQMHLKRTRSYQSPEQAGSPENSRVSDSKTKQHTEGPLPPPLSSVPALALALTLTLSCPLP